MAAAACGWSATLADLPGEIAAAEAEAASAFGDGTVFVEPYVERGRHVEVQVVGDATASILGERDCSLQRRHQKVVEEAPAPGLPDEVRAALHDAARAAAEAVDYRGAGTVEFLYDPATERFCFLEMNTRLQVEHPVTELVHGVDLVELQLAVAEGRGCDDGAGPTRLDGHAIEVRLYAEDPAADYQPQSGTLTLFDIPLERRRSGWTPASSRAARCRRTTTRCWPRSSPTRRPASRPPGSWPACCRAPGSTACAPTATSWSRCCATSAFLARRDVSTAFLLELRRARSQNLRHRDGARRGRALALGRADARATHRPARDPGRAGATSCRSRR